MKASPPNAVVATKHTTALVPRWARRLLHVFVQLKHVLCAIYFATQTYIYLTMDPSILHRLGAFSPNATAACYAVVALLHVVFLVWGCCRRLPCAGHQSQHNRTSSTLSTMSFLPSLAVPRWVCWPQVSNDTALTALNAIELVSQSYQLVVIMAIVVDRWFVVAYASVVVLHSFVTPWLFVMRRRTHAPHLHVLLVSWTSGVFNVSLSCVLPLVALIVPTLDCLVFHPALFSDRLWIVRMTLLSRVVVPATPLDLITKLVMDTGSLVSLRRLASLLATYDGAAVVPSPPSSPTSMSLAKTRTSFWHVVRRPTATNVFLFASAAWGLVLLVLCARVWLGGVACPSTCVARATRLVDLSCRCKYVHVNCHALGNESMDVDAALAPSVVGTALFHLRVSRCDLPNGLANTTLAAQLEVDTILVEFTNMRRWDDAMLPPTTMTLQIRYSQLTAVPSILRSNVPPTLASLVIEASPIAALPADVANTWQAVQILSLPNASFTHMPDVIPQLGGLVYLVLSRNAVGPRLASEWQAQVQTRMPLLEGIECSLCGLTDGPWTLATNAARVLFLTGNPISVLPPSSIVPTSQWTNRVVVVDNTTYCDASPAAFCQPSMCASTCFTVFVGDGLCDLGCFNAACNFDESDCIALGLTPLPG
ncbi:Aste57867_15518 [Aphanomyces stellatus]|uniref:Aste57867_15518 protein n=1 Tax=Aphanomyces stellatus TaxID=120398 RepID=A0A485L3B4_9STRA|nr:hypothetical protein As57867_015462 [Aphanomyces stellatus]VFT92320.1 Aste57867_15518 [Aphanomyces stellatus]